MIHKYLIFPRGILMVSGDDHIIILHHFVVVVESNVLLAIVDKVHP